MTEVLLWSFREVVFWLGVMFFFFEFCIFILCIFFFQAEDGIRDTSVTGVQTCALPISDHARQPETGGEQHGGPDDAMETRDSLADDVELGGPESFVSRVGKAGRGEIVDERDRKSVV